MSKNYAKNYVEASKEIMSKPPTILSKPRIMSNPKNHVGNVVEHFVEFLSNDPPHVVEWPNTT